jgi:hypothetical protein
MAAKEKDKNHHNTQMATTPSITMRSIKTRNKTIAAYIRHEYNYGSANVNFATLWLSCAFLTSLNSLKLSGSKQAVRTGRFE